VTDNSNESVVMMMMNDDMMLLLMMVVDDVADSLRIIRSVAYERAEFARLGDDHRAVAANRHLQTQTQQHKKRTLKSFEAKHIRVSHK
jgi:hypothetical protein